MSRQFHYRSYDVTSTLPEVLAKELVDDCLDKRYEPIKALKDNKHNFVMQVRTPDFPNVIIKEPRKRNKRRWEQIMTLFRPGEAVRVHASHLKLAELGFLCPTPLLAAEYRPRRMVTDSFLVYEYQEGRPAESKDAEAVARELQRFHGKGYTRGDPKAQNFLMDQDNVYFIDFKLSKPRFFRKHVTRMEYAHFLHTMPEGINYLSQKEQTSPGFVFATWLRRTISDLKRKKRDWRENNKRPGHIRKRHALLLALGAIIAYNVFAAT